MKHAGQVLRDELTSNEDIEPFLGIYDCFSASIAAPYSSNLFLSMMTSLTEAVTSFWGIDTSGSASWNLVRTLPAEVLS